MVSGRVFVHVEIDYEHNLWLNDLPLSGQEVEGCETQDILQRSSPL